MVPHPFTGYPYLVTRIGHSALRNMSVLPADWPRERLLDLVRRQAIANQLETCLCLGPTESVFVSPDGAFSDTDIIPTGIPVPNGLALAESIPDTAELAARRERLEAFAESLKAPGYLVGDGLEGGRPATADDISRLSGSTALGIPAGLSRCVTCGGFAGDFLATTGEGNGDVRPRVVRVHCTCENNEEDGKVWYAAAYIGLSHRCAA